MNRLRCAIYTRKSSDEGLEQDFNSLHAQREACEAYVRSQAHEGWRIIKTAYDDGGWSGGTLERPALQKLLADIDAGRVDVVVIYKIDRLTRALTDFAQLAERFDRQGVSFVAVTQQFNTTTSMGRLMLNVLLSFAQFEREITGERIRDKIAASKKKGLWMGGFVPLGYDRVDRQLVMNPNEARTVRALFYLYIRKQSVKAVHAETMQRGMQGKPKADGSRRLFSVAVLYKLLRNPIYAGYIRHHDTLYEGIHEAIVDRQTWQAVQDKLTDQARKPRQPNRVTDAGLLTGKLFGRDGTRYQHTHTRKGDQRYRYYTRVGDETHRLPAREVESTALQGLKRWLRSPARLLETLFGDRLPDCTATLTRRVLAGAKRLVRSLETLSRPERHALVSKIVDKAVVTDTELVLSLDRPRLLQTLDATLSNTDNEETNSSLRITEPMAFINRGGQLKLVTAPEQTSQYDPALAKAIAQAHAWYTELTTGKVKSLKAIAEREQLTPSWVARYLRLAFLAPDLVDAILNGKQPSGVTLRALTNRARLPSDWSEQRALFDQLAHR